MRYRYDGKAITADSAAAAALALARRDYGDCGGVESLRMIGRSWQNICGGGRICGKVWRAMLVLQPTAEQRFTGIGYTRRQRVVRIIEGRVKAKDMPAPEWPENEAVAAGSAMAAASAEAAAAAARQWRAEREAKWRLHAARARAALG